MKVIYIAGPFTAPNAWEIEQNVRRAEVRGMQVADLGAMPLIPHSNTRFFHGTQTVEFWYAGTLELMRRCDAVLLVIHPHGVSKGTQAEIAEADRLQLPVFHSLPALEGWLLDGHSSSPAR